MTEQETRESIAQDVIAAFVQAVRASGEVVDVNEETLTAPVRDLVGGMSDLVGGGAVAVVDKASVKAGDSRIGVPDLSIYQKGLLLLVIELKAPGKGADPRKFTGREKDQWQRYSQLPNVVYTDGNSWTLWRSGTQHGPTLKVCEAIDDPDEQVMGCGAEAARFFDDALSSGALTVNSTAQLARETARRCRSLRADVASLDPSLLNALTKDWRGALFPDLDDDGFVDAYAQTVAFALLTAKGIGIDLSLDVDPNRYDRLGLLLYHISERLGSGRGVLGRALGLLTADETVRSAVGASLEAMIALAAAVDWDAIRDSGSSDEWMDFYETFLGDYDPDLRKLSGSYYTPRPVVEWMTGFTNHLLIDLFGLPGGYACEDVTVVDPALGTGTYLVSILDRIAETVTASVGKGQAAVAMNEALAKRVIGFETQACPYAVAQLRLTESLKARDTELDDFAPAIYLTDTLADPNADTGQQMLFLKAITESREQADRIKRETPVKVVIGNPPYLSGAPQTNWVSQTMLDDWRPDPAWGIGAHAKNLSNLYVYFWRWAAWKVYENSGGNDAEQAGIVSFITTTGWLDGDGFQQMRRWLREWCSHIWVLDLSPEGHQAPSTSQVFGAMRQPVAIVTAIRLPGHTKPAEVRHHRVQPGDRTSKFDQIADLRDPCDPRWALLDETLNGREPLTPPASREWQQMPTVEDLLPWNGSGTKIGRTWPVAPNRDILEDRWQKLLEQTTDEAMTDHLEEHKRDRTIHTALEDNLRFPPFRGDMLYKEELCPDREEIMTGSSVMGLSGSSRRPAGRWPTSPGSSASTRARSGIGCAGTETSARAG